MHFLHDSLDAEKAFGSGPLLIFSEDSEPCLTLRAAFQAELKADVLLKALEEYNAQGEIFMESKDFLPDVHLKKLRQ